jgi:hypothetical protein
MFAINLRLLLTLVFKLVYGRILYGRDTTGSPEVIRPGSQVIDKLLCSLTRNNCLSKLRYVPFEKCLLEGWQVQRVCQHVNVHGQ